MNILLASTSTLFGGQYLSYLKDQIQELYAGIDEIIFIPYARPSGISYEAYTQKTKAFFETIGISVKGIHEFTDKEDALNKAKGYFTGGGNTFLLVKTLQDENLMLVLKENIKQGKAYLGCSAGTNIAGINMKTSNDMPIVYPASFDTMALVPFNINPHYLDPQTGLKHNGETRETRILEFLTQNEVKVIGLREGNWIRVLGTTTTIEGSENTRVFEKNKSPYELKPGHQLI